MYWRISSFPELDHLAETDRRTLLRRHIGLKVMYSLVVGALGGGFLCAVPMAYLHPLVPRPLVPYFVAFLFIAGSVISYQILLIRIRGQLLAYLEQIGRRQPLPMCLHCGYNLAGSTGSRCPECGHRLPQRAEPDEPEAS